MPKQSLAETMFGALLVAVAAAVIALPISTAAAETTPPPAVSATPRIGLALSGGGARGLAHVGVLKVLEELRVPVHCVTGTSMGAIVGGTYASGMPVAEMEKSVLAADWDNIFRDQPPRAETASRRKADDYKTLFAPEYGVKDGALTLPKGVVTGVSIEAFFRTLTERAVGIDDFRHMPVPFSAVAADIETGEAIVLDRGSLAHAMRASMSVPGALAPVEINGRLLVDGGIANNLPIDLSRDICADVVIAVNISTPPLKRDEITSALTVATQLINFLGIANVDRQLKGLGASDVLIAPDLGDITAGSFERTADAIRIGEEAARKMADSLKRYALPADQYAALRSRQTPGHKALGTVDEIRYEGLRRTNPEVLRSLVQTKPGEPLTEEKVSADLRRIYGRGDFESVDYRIEQGQAGRVMTILPREKDWGPDYLRFGLGLASDFQGGSLFNILAQYRRTWLNRLGGEWLAEAQIGQDTHLFTEFIQPVEARDRFFVAPYARIGQTTRDVFIADDRVAEYDVRDARAGLDVGVNLGSWGDARLGLVSRQVETSLNTGPAVFPDDEATSAGARARLFVDQQDTAWFPRSGFRVIGSAYVADEHFGSDRNYKRLEGQAAGIKSWGPHTFNFGAAGGTDLGTDMPAYESFTLGGPLRLSGYRINEFAGRRMEYGRAMYYNRTLPLPDLLGSGVYAGASVEAGRVSDRLDGLPTAGTIWSGSVFLAAETFAGPLYFGIGAGEGGRWSLYLLFGAP